MSQEEQLDTEKKTKKKKGRVGRPPKERPKNVKPRHGIVDSPSEKTAIVEFIYDVPFVMKKIWSLFKSLGVDRIQFICRPDSIIMWAKCHHGKNRVRIKFDCNKVNQYYVKDEIDIGFCSQDLEPIMNMIDKTYHIVNFAILDGQAQKNFWVVFKNESLIDEHHKIDVVGEYDHMDSEEEFLDEDHKIKFVLKGRYFKKTIADIKTMSKKMFITKNGNYSLMFKYNSDQNKVESTHVIRDSESIKLRSTVGEHEMFRVGFLLDTVKPFSSVFSDDYIRIHADENKDLLFISTMDRGAIEIRILSEIIRDKPVETPAVST